MIRSLLHEINFQHLYYVDRKNLDGSLNIVTTGENEYGFTEAALNPLKFNVEFAHRFLTEVAGQFWHDAGKDELLSILLYDTPYRTMCAIQRLCYHTTLSEPFAYLYQHCLFHAFKLPCCGMR